ncbi:7TM-DISM domain-containing protein [Paragemmobacter straminiformis]|nr:7TM-DISM domain-containing protein [Gemmobacter straminiformis]
MLRPAPLLRRLACACLAVFGLFLFAAPLRAEQRISYAVLVDPTRAMSLTDVQSARFTPIASTFGGGFTSSVYWLRVSIENPAPGPLLLRFRPSTTDEIELFTPLPDGRWRISKNGERLSPDNDAVPSINWYAFSIHPQAERGPWYVRISTRSPGAIVVTAVSANLALSEDVTTAGWLVINHALLCLAGAVLIGTLSPLRSVPNFGFLVMITSFSAYLYMINGYGKVLFGLTPIRAEAAQEYLACFTVTSLAAFHHLFLRDFRPSLALGRASLGLLAFSALGPLARLLGNGDIALRISLVTYVLLVPLLVALLVSLRQDGPITRRQVRYVYAVYIAFLLFNITARFGLIDAEVLYRHSIEAITVVTSTLMLTLLWLQNRSAQERTLARELALQSLSVDLAVDRQFVAARLALLRRIDTQVARVSAITLDCLASGGFGAAPARAQRAVTTLGRVVDRCIFAHEATGNPWNLRPASFAPAPALRALVRTLAPPDAFRLDIADAEGRRLTTDRDLFELAVENLLSNALRYGLPGHPVRIRLVPETRQGRAGLALWVSNAAPAAPFDPAAVFEKFYRGPSAQGQSGTGLGLFITREVVTALSGQVTLETAPAPHGATVRLILWLPEKP